MLSAVLDSNVILIPCVTHPQTNTQTHASHVLSLWIALVQYHILYLRVTLTWASTNQKEINFSIHFVYTHKRFLLQKKKELLPNSNYLVLILFTSMVRNLRGSWFSATATAVAVPATTSTIIATNETQPILLHVHSQLLFRNPFIRKSNIGVWCCVYFVLTVFPFLYSSFSLSLSLSYSLFPFKTSEKRETWVPLYIFVNVLEQNRVKTFSTRMMESQSLLDCYYDCFEKGLFLLKLQHTPFNSVHCQCAERTFFSLFLWFLHRRKSMHEKSFAASTQTKTISTHNRRITRKRIEWTETFLHSAYYCRLEFSFPL